MEAETTERLDKVTIEACIRIAVEYGQDNPGEQLTAELIADRMRELLAGGEE